MMKVTIKKEIDEETTGQELVSFKPMKCELDYLSRSDGSALLAQGRTNREIIRAARPDTDLKQRNDRSKCYVAGFPTTRLVREKHRDGYGSTVVLAAVNGPLETKMQNQHIMKATFEVLYCPKIGKPCVVDRYKENIIRQACELSVLKYLHPRTGITVTVQELEDYGGVQACVLNAVCLAFINAGLSMSYVFAAVSCVIDSTGNIVVDPTDRQSEGCLATLTFVFDGTEKRLMIAFTDGHFSETAYCEALEKCKVASETVFAFYRDIVKRYSLTVA